MNNPAHSNQQVHGLTVELPDLLFICLFNHCFKEFVPEVFELYQALRGMVRVHVRHGQAQILQEALHVQE